MTLENIAKKLVWENIDAVLAHPDHYQENQ